MCNMAYCESMRDLCGEFYCSRGKSCKHSMVYLIPALVAKYVNFAKGLADEARAFGVNNPVNCDWDDKKEVLAKLYDFLLNTYEPTKQVISDWDSGKRGVKDFTDDEVSAICDGFFKEFTSL